MVRTTESTPAGYSNSLSSKAAGESKPEAYPPGYVEDFDEPRTTLADCLSSLLDGNVASTVVRRSRLMG